MHNTDPYGFGTVLSLEAFDTTGLDLTRADDANAISELVSAANSMEELSETLLTNQAVSRNDAVTMESIAPGILPTRAPVNSFTLHPTATNLKVALEAIGNWRNLNIANMLKAIYKFVANVISWVINKIKSLFGKGSDPKDGKRVVDNLRLTVTAADDIITQTSPNVDAKSIAKYNEALEKAKLKVSDHFNHLVRDLVNSPGTISALNNLRSNIHTAYAKVDTLSNKFTIALDLCKAEGTYQEANNLLSDLAAFKPETLVDLKELAMVIDITKRSAQLKGDEQAKALRELCGRQSAKRSSWDVKTQDTVQAFHLLADRVVALLDAVDDPQIGTDIPEVKDFSEKAKGAPDAISSSLINASDVMTRGFEVMQDVVAVLVAIYQELMSLVQVMWDAAKFLMGAVATTAKQTSEVKETVASIEARLKTALKKA